MAYPTFAQLKRLFLESGYEIRFFPRRKLEELALDAPYEVKRHKHSNILGIIVPDEGIIALAEDLDLEDRAVTLLHELIHLFDPEMDEVEVENTTLDLESNLSSGELGFLKFLVS